MPEEKSAASRKPVAPKSALPTADKPITTQVKAKKGATKPVTEKTAKTDAKPAAKKATKTSTRPATRKKPVKAAKIKVIRDSFTMPQNEYDEIARIKVTFKKAGMQVKKSEILRAGLKALVKLTATQQKTALAGLEKIKTGRPNKQ